jgi:predicted nucleic acid-binding protein
MTRILIDTDVILDFFFNREPFAESAAKVLSLCELKEIKAFVTPVIISNVYYLLRQTAKHEKIIEKLKLLVSITDILIIDKKVVIQALNSDFKDFLYSFLCSSVVNLRLIETVLFNSKIVTNPLKMDFCSIKGCNLENTETIL